MLLFSDLMVLFSLLELYWFESRKLHSIARWLASWSLASGLDCPCPAPDLWLTSDHFVDKLSAMGLPTRPAQPSNPQGSVN